MLQHCMGINTQIKGKRQIRASSDQSQWKQKTINNICEYRI